MFIGLEYSILCLFSPQEEVVWGRGQPVRWERGKGKGKCDHPAGSVWSDRTPAALWSATGVAGRGGAEAVLLGLEGAGLLSGGRRGQAV